MPIDLKILGGAVVLGLVQLLWAAFAARRQQDLKWAAGPRDEPMPISGVAARLDRAFWNFLETFPFYAAAVLAVAIGGCAGPLSLWGGALYLVGRIVYVPLYASGVRLWRTLAWAIAMIGIFMVVACLFV